MEDCIFCAIAVGDAPATVVEEDGDTIAFMDINPWQRGHTLVIPRRHYEDLLEIEAHDLTSTYATARRVAARMTEQLGAKGVVLLNSCGAAAGQEVMHFHVHVLPVADALPPMPRPAPADQAELGEVADILRGS